MSNYDNDVRVLIEAAAPRRHPIGRAIVLWTGGKDCSMALHAARRFGLRIEELITFAPPDPIFLAHPIPFLKRQTDAMGLRHRVIEIQAPYEAGYTRALRALREDGIRTVITGDIAEVDGTRTRTETRAALFRKARTVGLKPFHPTTN